MEKQITFSVEEILPHIKKALAVVPQRSVLPAYEMFLVTLTPDANSNVRTTVTASDGDNTVVAEIPVSHANVAEAYSFCVVARTFHQGLMSIVSGEVRVTVDDETGSLRCDYPHGHFALPITDAAEYPIIREHNTTTTRTMKSETLSALIDATEYAVADDPLRPAINGVRMEFTDTAVIAVGTDGRCLVRYTVGDYDDTAATTGFTLPHKAAVILRNLCDDAPVNVSYGENFIKFTTDTWALTSRMTEMRFPNYNAVIPKDFAHHITIEREAIIAAVKRVMPLGSATTGLVTFDFSSARLRVSCADIDLATSAVSDIPCTHNEGDLRIGFHGATVLRVWTKLHGELLVIDANTPDKAALFYCKENPTLRTILMPLKID